MNIKILSNEKLLIQIRSLVREEARLITDILHHLREVESRKLFAALGYSSLFEYVIKDLGYGEASAQRRIAAMRLLREIPDLEVKIKRGDLSLSVVAQAQTFFRQEEKLGKRLSLLEKEEVVKCLEGKSSREAERALLSLSTAPERHHPDRVRPLSETTSLMSFVLSEEAVEDLKQLKGLLAHQHPDLSLGELVALLAKRALKELDPAKKEVKRSVSAPEVQEAKNIDRPPSKKLRQAIPVSTRRAVWARDGSRCTFTYLGRRCESRYQLEIDHIHGLSVGNNLENLRLLCKQHNAWVAAKMYGQEKMQHYWRI